MNTHQHLPLPIPGPAVPRIAAVPRCDVAQPLPAFVRTGGPVDYPAPFVDDDGLLRFHDRWVALTDLQVPVVRLLIANLGRMVSVDELRAAYARAGGSEDRAALRSLMHRIGRRVTRVGASVTYARQRAGMMVTIPVGSGGMAS